MGSSSPSSCCRVGMAEPTPLGVGGSPGRPGRLRLQRWSQHDALKHLTCLRWFVSPAWLPTSWSVGTTSLAKRRRCPWSAEHPQQQRREGPSSTTAGLHRAPRPFQHPLSLLPAPPGNRLSSPAGGGTEAAAVGSGTAFPPQPGVADPRTLAFLVTVSMPSPLGPCSDRRRGAAISLGRTEEGPGPRRASTVVRCSAGGRRCIYYFYGCEAFKLSLLPAPCPALSGRLEMPRIEEGSAEPILAGNSPRSAPKGAWHPPSRLTGRAPEVVQPGTSGGTLPALLLAGDSQIVVTACSPHGVSGWPGELRGAGTAAG